MDTTTRVQTQDISVCLLHSNNTLGKYNYSIPSKRKIVEQTGLFNLGMATDLGEGKLWIQTCKTLLYIEFMLRSAHTKRSDIYIYIRGEFNKFPDFFCTGIWNCRRLLKIHYVIAIHLMRWQTNFYDFRFKSTATAGIGIHPTKAWLSQLVNFKNAIWTCVHIRRTICNKILF